ncbi:MAG TPA: hypothetical protein PLB38_00865 [bacterium]|nr:hypothetical protein [bacterium]
MKTKFPTTQKFIKNDDCLKMDFTLEILDLMGWNMENWFFQREKLTIVKQKNNKKLK